MFSFFLSWTVALTNHMMGDTFFDDFSHENHRIWLQETEKLRCLELHADTKQRDRCVLLSEHNIEYLPPHQDAPKGEVNLHYRNDCHGAHCCAEHTKKCTKLSVGQLSSYHGYGYGSFRFVGKVVGVEDMANCVPESFCNEKELRKCDQWAREGQCMTNPDYMTKCCKPQCGCQLDKESFLDVWSCFMLENKDTNLPVDQLLAIGFCVPSRAPNQVQIIRQYASKAFSKAFRLNFNAAKQTTSFRFDWHPEYIKWFVNGLLMHEIKNTSYTIPEPPLHIKVFILPRHKSTYDDPPLEPLDLRMRLFQVRYPPGVRQLALVGTS